MTPEPTSPGSPLLAKLAGAVFLLVFITTGVGMAVMAARMGAPWIFSLVPGGLALVGVIALVMLFKGGATPRSEGTPTPTPTPPAARRCRYCGRPAQGPEVICAGCQGPVDG